jgi:uncharacterized coiled-coil protein SlyX
LETFGKDTYDPHDVARTLRAAAATVHYVNDANDALELKVAAQAAEIDALKLQVAQEASERIAAQRRLIPHVIAEKKRKHPTTASERRKRQS